MRFVARQPILDTGEHTYGYELLFRSGLEAAFCGADADLASHTTLDSSLLIGLDVICGGTRAFLNCTREILLHDFMLLLPASMVVVEVLETIEGDAEIMSACLRLKQAGYLIALDDFVPGGQQEPLVELADIIKVDFRALKSAQCRQLVERCRPLNTKMLAEKVETRAEYRSACEMGFTYFQGFFFAKPQTLSSREVPFAKLNYLRMIEAAHRPTLNYMELEQLIKSEVSLYRLLRYLNSASFYFRSEITGIRHALTILGEDQIRRWISLVASVAAGRGKAVELINVALTRARFCELLGPQIRYHKPDIFFLGLFSLLDVLLGMPMPDLLNKMPMSKEITNALLLNDRKSKLCQVYELLLTLESGDWDKYSALCAALHVEETKVSEDYLNALRWVRQTLEQMCWESEVEGDKPVQA